MCAASGVAVLDQSIVEVSHTWVITGTVTRQGEWSSDCASNSRPGAYARYYTFTLSRAAVVTASLDSTDIPEVDTYLNLLSGSGAAGAVLAYDDDSGNGANSYLSRSLAAGTYTVEATTFSDSRTGKFRVSMQVAGSAGPGCSVIDLGAISSGDRASRLGAWAKGCVSQNRSGKYARFYSFQVSETSDVLIGLNSVDDPSVDTYLYLISGSSRTGTVLRRDDSSGDGSNSKIVRRLSPGTYIVEATTYWSAQTGRFTIAVEVSKPVASTSAASAYLGQRVTLSATAPVSEGAVSTYQWQRWNGSGWVNHGFASATSTYSVINNAVEEQVFRVVVRYANGGVALSNPVSVEWVSAAHVSYSPDMPEINDTVVLAVDGSGGLLGATYQWQQANSAGNWTNLGTASSSRFRSVVFSIKGTRKFRLVVSYPVGRVVFTDTSDPVYVTWGERDLVADLVADLDTAVFGSSSSKGVRSITGNANFAIAERDFLVCVNAGLAMSNKFTSFQEVLSAYYGIVATTVDNCESRSINPTRVFAALNSSVHTELAILAKSNPLYRYYLATPGGLYFSSGLASEHTLKLFGSVHPRILPSPFKTTGYDCLPSTEPPTVAGKLQALNCLVFRTSHHFWATGGAALRQRIDRDGWLGRGNWVCDYAPDLPLPVCQKHDVGFALLQRFYGIDSVDELDQTWNPRNKALADAKFWVDIAQHGCIGGPMDCYWASGGIAYTYFTGVAKGNHKGWPVTTQDLDHARAHQEGDRDRVSSAPSAHAYVDCAGPVPSVDGFTVRRETTGQFRANWTHQSGCVSNIVIEQIEVVLTVYFEGGLAARHREVLSDGAATSLDFRADYFRGYSPIAVDAEFSLKPADREYGGKAYRQKVTLTFEPGLQ